MALRASRMTCLFAAAMLVTLPLAVRAQSMGIAATVNGDVITRNDVDNRAKLFALSTGLPDTPEVLDRLRGQTLRQLVDERLRLNEAERRHIVISDKEIAKAIAQIEQRNQMKPGALRDKLASQGVDMVTLVDQIRAQLGWTEVVKQKLGEDGQITAKEIDARQKLLASETGKPEFQVDEIFIPVDNPSNAASAQGYANEVIKQLRAGAVFSTVAAQFSQSQTALEGGNLGWVQPNELDPQVASVVQQMPVGAISNPIAVPGGFSIVALRAKREIGRDIGTMISLRQLFLPFNAPLDPQNPTAQQRATLVKAKSISDSVHSCDQMEAMAKQVNSPRPPDPGPVRLDTITPPQFRTLLTALPDNKATQPLVAPDGIAVVIVCSRKTENLSQESKDQIADQIIGQRVELLSRQLLGDLRRRALIDIRAEPDDSAIKSVGIKAVGGKGVGAKGVGRQASR